jgi:ornithine cyclodeaminase/alanine dehydrogenase-like protein (mu-crystallin family)
MTLLLTEENVRALLDMPTALRAVEESFWRQSGGDAWLQPRRRLELPGRSFLNDMTAADRKGGFMGAKLYSVARAKHAL